MHRTTFAALSRRLRGVPKFPVSVLARMVSTRNLILHSSAQAPVRLERLSDSDSGIVELKLERPEAKNAISKSMLKGLRDALEDIDRDSSANVVLLTSSVPKVFCAGADLKERKLMSVTEVQNFVNTLRSTFSFLEVLSVPTVAVLEGAALGGGLELALACDLRICGDGATFSLPETRLAIIPGSSSWLLKIDHGRGGANGSAGGTQRLPRIIGKALAKELIYTSRKIDAKYALSIGLVNYCVPSGEAYIKALDVARDINKNGPLALRMAKRAINEGMDVDMSSALEIEEQCYDKLLNTKDRLEGLAAFVEKRLPRYNGD